jgi:heavy metal sensor kinase
MNFRRTITFRITLWYLTILVVLLVLFGIGVYGALSKALLANLDRTLLARAKQLSEFRDILSIVAGGRFEDEAGEYICFYYYDGGRLDHISTRGRKFPVSAEMIERAFAGEHLLASRELSGGGVFRVYVSPFTPEDPLIRQGRVPKPPRRESPPPRDDDDKGGRPPRPRGDSRDPNPDTGPERRFHIESAALVVARPAGDIETVLNLLRRIFYFAIPLTLTVSALGGIFLARRALKPVRQITDTARQIGETDLTHRIDVETEDELGHLAETLNAMISRLERAFERQKEFTGDASHELRTPLAVIRAEATLAIHKERSAQEYRKTLTTIAGEAANMAALLNSLLELARSDTGKRAYLLETINLDDLIEEICSDLVMSFHEKDLELKTELAKQIQIRGDRNGLRQLMGNLLNNALRYTDPGGRVTVTLVKRDKTAFVSVCDTGIGIPSEQIPFIFERFYRVDKARSRSAGGFGLGLAICKQIVEAHGGKISAESQPGGGTVFTVELPEFFYTRPLGR